MALAAEPRIESEPARAAPPLPRRVLAASVGLAVCSNAVFFAGAAVAPALVGAWGLTEPQAASLSWSTQAGFIAGTLATAALNLPDRVSPSRLAALLLVLASVANAGFAFLGASQFGAALGLRFLAGALAGPVYPITMKLLATWSPRLGWQLGLLVAGISLGSGAAFLLRAAQVPWQESLLGASVLGLAGAGLALTMRAGPRLPARSPFDVRAAARAFRQPDYRRSALAYFGHMWELFAFWALVPLWLAAAGLGAWAIPLSAGVFVAGGAGSALAGWVSRRAGEARVARTAIGISGSLCLLSPLLFGAPLWVLAPAMLLWGGAVIADSGMFSAISARTAPQGYVGTALTVQNAIGFGITIGSLALLPAIAQVAGWRWAFLALAPGPLLGLIPLATLVRRNA